MGSTLQLNVPTDVQILNVAGRNLSIVVTMVKFSPAVNSRRNILVNIMSSSYKLFGSQSIGSSDHVSTGYWPPDSLYTLGTDGHI